MEVIMFINECIIIYSVIELESNVVSYCYVVWFMLELGYKVFIGFLMVVLDLMFIIMVMGMMVFLLVEEFDCVWWLWDCCFSCGFV